MLTCPQCGYIFAPAGSTHVLPIRPRVKPSSVNVTTKGGRSYGYHDKGYDDWKAAVGGLAGKFKPMFDVPLFMDLTFRFKEIGVGDADNLQGGVMDALQGLWYPSAEERGDKLVEEWHGKIERHTGKDEIEVSIWAL